MSLRCCVLIENPERAGEARQLADRCDYPLFEFPGSFRDLSREQSSDFDVRIVFGPEYVSVEPLYQKGMKPLYVDFDRERLARRVEPHRIGSELLVKTAQIKKIRMPLDVLDATAGLGKESFLLAAAGHSVRAVERSPVVAALLRDGLQRARDSENPLIRDAVSRITLIEADAEGLMGMDNMKQGGSPDVVYMDPMYPERKKTALVKKDMQIFHRLVGITNDVDSLFRAAMRAAKKRVIVKRPVSHGPIDGMTPTFSREGKLNRYDVYSLD